MIRRSADAAILSALCLVLVLPLLFTNRTILPVDWLGITPTGPYKYTAPHQPHPYTLDPTGSLGGDFGFVGYAAESLKHGTIPFWNPYQSLGEPFLAEGGSQVVYPPNWLHTVIPVEYWDVLRFLHFFLASWFVYLFAAECGLDRWCALLAGACVYAQGFFQGFLAMNMIVAAFTWLPLILFGVERYVNGKRSAASFAAIAGGTFMMATGSHAGLAIVCTITVLAYLVLRCLTERNIRAAVAMLFPFLVGTLCSTPSWGPFLQNVLSVREVLGTTREYITPQLFPSLFFPFVYSSLYSPIFGSTAVSLGARSYGWMPAAVVFLAMAGIVSAAWRRNKRMLTLAAIAIWLLLWMMDIPPFNLLRHISLIRRLTLAYLLCSIQLLICVLAGYGVSVFLTASRRQLAVTAGVWLAFVAANAAIVASVLRAAGPNLDLTCVLAGIVPNITWAVAVPALLYGSLLFTRRRGLETVPIAVAFALVAGAAMAFFPSGAAYNYVLFTRMLTLLAVAACVVAALLQRDLHRSVRVTTATLLLVNIALVAKYPGLPKRANPFDEAPFVRYLKQQPQSGREYGLRAILFPDLSSKLALPSINELTMMLPRTTMMFLQHYADPCQNPAQLYGIDRPDCLPLTQILQRRAVWDYLGIRNVLGINADEIVADQKAWWSTNGFTPFELRGAAEFPVVVANEANAVEVLISTAGRINRGPVTFTLRDAKREIIVTRHLDGATLPVQDWAVFARDSGAKIPAGIYRAELTFQPANPESAIVLWRDQLHPEHCLNRLASDHAGFRLVFSSPEDRVPVWENQSAKATLYVAPQNAAAIDPRDAQAKFTGQLDLHHTAYLEPVTRPCQGDASFPAGRESSTLKDFKLTPNRVDASIEAASAGTLVYVGSFTSGWTARIDGHPAGVFRVNGAFLGACLPAAGPHRVSFEYQPPFWYESLFAAALGIALACGGLLFRRRLPGVLNMPD